MKQNCTLTLVALVALFFVVTCPLFTPYASAKAKKEDNGQVIVYNWSEFIPQDVLDNFTKETGIKVVYSTFESNEAMFAKVKLLQGKGYDVIFPSGYFVGQMVQDKLVAELDHSRLPNMANLDPKMLSLAFDQGNKYSIPYMWGIVGLAYNTKYVPKGSITKWVDLLRPEYKGRVILTDDLRDAFGLALHAVGFSVNAVDPKQIEAGYEFLNKLKPSVRVFDVTAIKQALISEEVWLGPIWNGDYLVAKEENPDLEFIYPEEGAVLWVDNFVLSAGASNVDNAYTFINYMMRPEVAVRCMEEYKYSTVNKKALELLPDDMRNNVVLVPTDAELKNSEFPIGIGETLQTYQKFWEQLKTNR